jgi:hypothetical protein
MSPVSRLKLKFPSRVEKVKKKLKKKGFINKPLLSIPINE